MTASQKDLMAEIHYQLGPAAAELKAAQELFAKKLAQVIEQIATELNRPQEEVQNAVLEYMNSPTPQ
jgi:hypothetical protein